MKKIKNTKGITLIALIITVLILLILAVVSINAIQNDGILEYAENAKTSYTQGQVNEQGTLQGYLNYLGNHTVGEEKVKFSIIGSGGAREYTVKPGTTFEQFAKEQRPEDDSGELFLFKDDGSLVTCGDYVNYPQIKGAVIVGGALALTIGEEHNINEGPYVFPSTIIKDGDVYHSGRGI